MKRVYLILIAILLLQLLSLAGYAQGPLTVYDGRVDSIAKTPSNAEIQLIKRYALPKARSAWRSDQYCTEGFEAISVAQGSFTKANSKQKAVMYRFCVKGHDIANNGIVIIEGGKITAHIIYNGGEDNSIQTLPDINGDGLSEIILDGGATHQGYTESMAIPITLSAAGTKSYGMAIVFEDDCGANPDRCKTLAYKITVRPGTNPTFYRETYSKKNGRGTRTGAAVRYTLGKTTGIFRLLK